MPTPQATKYIDQKAIDTRAMSTAEWDMVDAQIRERAFFMACVADAKILKAFRDAARGIVTGEYSDAEARRVLRQQLREFGYQPSEDERGGIHDLSSVRRMEVTLETNVLMAHGWAMRQAMLGDVANPGLELYRASKAAAPRDWEARWQEAADSVGWEGVVRDTKYKIALTESPIWCALSRFNQPYPPFDFNSHMRVKPVPVDRCRELGLFPDEEEDAEEETDTTSSEDKTEGSMLERLPERVGEYAQALKDRASMLRRREPDLNEDVEIPLIGFSRKERKALVRALGGMGKVVKQADGNYTVRMTNLNGTTTVSSQDLADAWKAFVDLDRKGLIPDDLKIWQMEAYKRWVTKSSTYDALDSRSKKVQIREHASDKELQILRQFFNRLETYKGKETLYRGMSFKTKEAMEDLVRRLENKNLWTYSPKPGKPADCFSSSISNAERFAAKHDFEMILKVVKHRSGRDLRPFYDAVPPPKQMMRHPLKVEAEVVFLEGTKFKITGKNTYRLGKKGIRVVYTLEEMEP